MRAAGLLRPLSNTNAFGPAPGAAAKWTRTISFARIAGKKYPKYELIDGIEILPITLY